MHLARTIAQSVSSLLGILSINPTNPLFSSSAFRFILNQSLSSVIDIIVSKMGAEPRQLHVMFFPFLAHGHMIPTLDIARLFASRGAKTTIITTPRNAPTFLHSIQATQKLGTPISLEIFPFPAKEAGLPDGLENLEHVAGQDTFNKFLVATETLLRPQLEQLLQDILRRPDCLVADMFFPWATDTAVKFNIPRLVFHGTSFFSLCVSEVLRIYQPQRKTDDEEFILPHLPHQIRMSRLQLSEFERERENVEHYFTRFMDRVKESEVKSYGVIVNSFYELEPDYADHYRKVLGRRAWHIGPVSLCNKSIEEKAQRGKEAAIDEQECLKWLHSKGPNSIIYICFGSTAKFSAAQLREIALALDASGQQFILVVRDCSDQEWMPEDFEKRMEGKGLIVRGWAPQVLILDHEAVGAFVTHCGWNSTLEGISSGVPLVTWPVFAEQFHNEKLVTEVLKIGIPVGAKEWSRTALVSESVKREAIEKAVRRVIVGKEAEEMRSRAKQFKEMAWRAVEEGGSSYSDLGALIEELRSDRVLDKRQSGLVINGVSTFVGGVAFAEAIGALCRGCIVRKDAIL
ncbi:hypothetical protein Ancab_003086 [Ancistrocladus abbreviatus]